jgi:hypothetical protein
VLTLAKAPTFNTHSENQSSEPEDPIAATTRSRKRGGDGGQSGTKRVEYVEGEGEGAGGDNHTVQRCNSGIRGKSYYNEWQSIFKF